MEACIYTKHHIELLNLRGIDQRDTRHILGLYKREVAYHVSKKVLQYDKLHKKDITPFTSPFSV